MGAALGRAGLARRTTLGMSTLVIANNLPDVDVSGFSHRYAWPCHSVAAGRTAYLRRRRYQCCSLAACLPTIDRVVQKRSQAPPPARVGEVLLLSYIGVLVHVVLDLLNSYGVRLLMPLSGRWFYGDALYIVDPLMYLMLGTGWWLSARRSRKQRADAAQPARIGLAVAVIYMFVMVASNMAARAEVPRRVGAGGTIAATRDSW